MSIEFLGNKSQLLEFIFNNVSNNTDALEVIDLFSGTGSVGLKFKEEGFKVFSNDFLYFCSLFAKKNLYLYEEPNFSGIIEGIPQYNSTLFETPYDRVIQFLNSLKPAEGFIYRSYSPAAKHYFDIERMYFTEKNAAMIDAVRIQISLWKPFLTEAEEALLITDLLTETVNVSNIAGTYGCYLKHWKPRALNNFFLKKSFIPSKINEVLDHRVYNTESSELIKKISAPIVYADPPYTKRQYSAYYHILETIAIGDEPDITGKTGLRPWEDKKSDFCYKRKAPSALENLIKDSNCDYFFLSYNSDGQIPHKLILDILSGFGQISFVEQEYKRYKSNNRSTKDEPLKERLYTLKKS
jgi:adenine-specific DNA-methyltransferase